MNSVLEKSWVSPFAAFSFLVVSATGILMLFHVKGHVISYIHHWMGAIFVVAVLLHLILNWRQFLSCFKDKQSIFSIVLVLLLVMLLLLSGMFSGQMKTKYGGRGWDPKTHHR